MSDVISFDTETYYDAEYSVTEQGQYHYVTDPRFDCYLISVYAKDWHYVGRPKDFDWEKLNGKHVVCHNMAFDRLVFWHMKKLGIVPEHIKPAEFDCTMDLSLFLTGHGSLKDAVRELLGVEISKETRDYMKGKRWADVVAEGKDKELLKYAYDDAKYCYDIWDQYNSQWPPQERRLSRMTVKHGLHGVLIDQPKLHSYIKIVKTRAIQALEALPWIQASVEYLSDDSFLQKGDEWYEPTTDKWTVVKKRFKKDKDNAITPFIGDEVGDYKHLRCRRVTPGSPALSLHALRDKCIEVGLEPPKSFGEKDKECIEFEEKYAGKYDFIGNVRLYRKANKLLKKLELIKSRIKPDGRFPFSLRYFGTRTGRWSGGGGFNMQNINKKSSHFPELNEKSLFIAPEGSLLADCDLAQIEARLTFWVCGDYEMLELCKKYSIYEAYARKTGWTGGNLQEEDKQLYALKKAQVLSLGFGASFEKFIIMVSLYGLKAEEIFGKEPRKGLQEEFINHHKEFEYGRNKIEQFNELDELHQRMWLNAWEQVREYRTTSPKVPAKWKELDKEFKASEGETYTVNLPSWRALRYRDVSEIDDEWGASLGKKRTRFYGSALLENICQGIARDVFAECLFKLEDAGYKILWTVHDSAILEVPANTQENDILKLMRINPIWLPSCPLDAKCKMAKHYGAD